jgi:hypothetical protein
MQVRTPLALLLPALAAPAQEVPQQPQQLARLEGEVLSPTGTPVANAEVAVEHDGVVVTRMRAGGAFAVPCPVGTREQFALRSLAAGDALRMRFADPGGTPVAGAEVMLWLVDKAGERGVCIGAGRSGLDGRLCCPGLRLGPPTRIEIEALAPAGHGIARQSVAARGTNELGTLTLAPSSALAGEVTDQDGAPAAAAPVLVQRTDVDPRSSTWIVSDRAGRFLLGGLSAGTYCVAAYGNRSVALRPSILRLAPGERTDLALVVTR